MISEHSQNVAKKSQEIYRKHLQVRLEAEEPNRFVAIEPESGEHFIADSFSEAVAAARTAYPDRISFVIRIGSKAALHIGGIAR